MIAYGVRFSSLDSGQQSRIHGMRVRLLMLPDAVGNPIVHFLLSRLKGEVFENTGFSTIANNDMHC